MLEVSIVKLLATKLLHNVASMISMSVSSLVKAECSRLYSKLKIFCEY